MNKRTISRRIFLMGTAAAAAGMAGGPADAKKKKKRKKKTKSPNEKLNIAGIGIGGQGRFDIHRLADENIVALCDVDWRKAKATFKAFPDAKKYKDFRVMLEKRKDIDAVVVATPDHMHAAASIMAMQLGKHVYCEKPLTHTVYEARKMAEAAAENKAATQMGNAGQADDSVRSLCEYIWDGVIGPVREVHAWTDRPIWPQGLDRPEEVHEVHDDLDWDLWLGTAPDRPYNRIYHPFRWRGWWDFGTGALGDMGCHRLDEVFRALKLGPPSSVEASSSKVFDETYPLASIIRYEFPARGAMPPVKVTWYDGGLLPPRPDELEDGEELADNGVLFVGDKGKILDRRLLPESRMEEYTPPAETLPRSIGHYQEWIQACKGGEPAGAHFGFAGPLTEAVLLGNIALRTGQKLQWDSPNLKITNVDEANQFLHRQYRKGWSL